MKAATLKALGYQLVIEISIHAAREGGDGRWERFIAEITISIHAAREGGDPAA